MAADFPSEIVVRDHGSLVDALRAAKEHLQISNETIEELAGLCAGHVHKIFSGDKRCGPLVFGLVCSALGIEFVMRQDPQAAAKMAHRWTERDARQVRGDRRDVPQAMLDRCRPIILAELGRKGAIATNKLMAERRRNGNGHANGHQNGNGYKG